MRKYIRKTQHSQILPWQWGKIIYSGFLIDIIFLMSQTKNQFIYCRLVPFPLKRTTVRISILKQTQKRTTIIQAKVPPQEKQMYFPTCNDKDSAEIKHKGYSWADGEKRSEHVTF